MSCPIDCIPAPHHRTHLTPITPQIALNPLPQEMSQKIKK